VKVPVKELKKVHHGGTVTPRRGFSGMRAGAKNATVIKKND